MTPGGRHISQSNQPATPLAEGGSVCWTSASLSELTEALTASLLLEIAPVGVRIIRSAEDFEACEFPRPQVPVHYCSAVKMATEGTCLKLDLSDMGCDTAPRTLGLEPGFLDDDFVQSYVDVGLYADKRRAEEVLSNVEILSDTVGIVLGPLSEFEGQPAPDVVIIPSLPYAAMRLTQAASFNGESVRSNTIGMHGICSECTAAPIETGEVCTSLLCSGTRHIAGWNDQLVSVGIPMAVLPSIVAALMRTSNRYESDERKAEMRSSCSCAAPRSPRVATQISNLADGAGYFYR